MPLVKHLEQLVRFKVFFFKSPPFFSLRSHQGNSPWFVLRRRVIEIHTDTHRWCFTLISGLKWLTGLIWGTLCPLYIWSELNGGRRGEACAKWWMAKMQKAQEMYLLVKAGVMCALWFWSLNFRGMNGFLYFYEGWRQTQTQEENVPWTFKLFLLAYSCLRNLDWSLKWFQNKQLQQC